MAGIKVEGSSENKVLTGAGVFLLEDDGSLREYLPFESDEEALETISRTEMTPDHIDLYHNLWLNLPGILDQAGLTVQDYRKIIRQRALYAGFRGLEEGPTTDEEIGEAVGFLGDLDKAMMILLSRLDLDVDLDKNESDVIDFLQKSKEDSTPIQDSFLKAVKSVIESRVSLVHELDDLLKDYAPTLSGFLGSLLAAKLLNAAGGLKGLAMMPGSRIQVLGAEQALFNHLKKKGPSPKHGLIFQHPAVSMSPWWQRGKIARSLAAKIALAARFDAFGTMDRSEELRISFAKRLKLIKENFRAEPKKMRIIKAPRTISKRKARHKKRRGGRR